MTLQICTPVKERRTFAYQADEPNTSQVNLLPTQASPHYNTVPVYVSSLNASQAGNGYKPYPTEGTRMVSLEGDLIHYSTHRAPSQNIAAPPIHVPLPRFDRQMVEAQRRIYETVWPHLAPKAWELFPAFCALYTQVKSFNLPNCLGARKTLSSGLNLHQWEQLLATYHDREICNFLRYGWPVGYHKPTPPTSTVENHQTAKAFPAHIQQFLKVELQHDAIVGPFPSKPFTPWTRESPLMTRPKKDSDNRRVIVDLSFPEGSAVNDGINIQSIYGVDTTYSLPSVQDLVAYIQAVKGTAWLWKADLSRAYRQLRVDPIDTPLLGVQFDGQIYVDLCPPFGCRSSSSACQRVSQAVVYLMAQEGFTVLAFLDDFAGCEMDRTKAEAAYACFIRLTTRLGLQLANDKCAPPATIMQWLGYDINAQTMIISIPQEKLKEVLAICQLWSAKKRASRQMIQSLLGKLIHLVNCVRHARKFTARILETLRYMNTNGKDWTTVNDEFKADIAWFRHYAEQANGVSLFAPVKEKIYIECDSSLTGGGANTDLAYYRWKYTKQHTDRYAAIHQLEAVNALVAYRTLCPSHETAGKCVVILTDNLSSSFALEYGRSKDRVLCACAREIWLEAAKADHDIQICHKSGALIPLADTLSRYDSDPEKAKLADQLIREKSLFKLDPKLNDYVFFNEI